jgi:hypothetical protein
MSQTQENNDDLASCCTFPLEDLDADPEPTLTNMSVEVNFRSLPEDTLSKVCEPSLRHHASRSDLPVIAPASPTVESQVRIHTERKKSNQTKKGMKYKKRHRESSSQNLPSDVEDELRVRKVSI